MRNVRRNVKPRFWLARDAIGRRRRRSERKSRGKERFEIGNKQGVGSVWLKAQLAVTPLAYKFGISFVLFKGKTSCNPFKVLHLSPPFEKQVIHRFDSSRVEWGIGVPWSFFFPVSSPERISFARLSDTLIRANINFRSNGEATSLSFASLVLKRVYFRTLCFFLFRCSATSLSLIRFPRFASNRFGKVENDFYGSSSSISGRDSFEPVSKFRQSVASDKRTGKCLLFRHGNSGNKFRPTGRQQNFPRLILPGVKFISSGTRIFEC